MASSIVPQCLGGIIALAFWVAIRSMATTYACPRRGPDAKHVPEVPVMNFDQVFVHMHQPRPYVVNAYA